MATIVQFYPSQDGVCLLSETLQALPGHQVCQLPRQMSRTLICPNERDAIRQRMLLRPPEVRKFAYYVVLKLQGKSIELLTVCSDPRSFEQPQCA